MGGWRDKGWESNGWRVMREHFVTSSSRSPSSYSLPPFLPCTSHDRLSITSFWGRMIINDLFTDVKAHHLFLRVSNYRGSMDLYYPFQEMCFVLSVTWKKRKRRKYKSRKFGVFKKKCNEFSACGFCWERENNEADDLWRAERRSYPLSSPPTPRSTRRLHVGHGANLECGSLNLSFKVSGGIQVKQKAQSRLVDET